MIMKIKLADELVRDATQELVSVANVSELEIFDDILQAVRSLRPRISRPSWIHSDPLFIDLGFEILGRLRNKASIYELLRDAVFRFTQTICDVLALWDDARLLLSILS